MHAARVERTNKRGKTLRSWQKWEAAVILWWQESGEKTAFTEPSGASNSSGRITWTELWSWRDLAIAQNGASKMRRRSLSSPTFFLLIMVIMVLSFSGRFCGGREISGVGMGKY